MSGPCGIIDGGQGLLGSCNDGHKGHTQSVGGIKTERSNKIRGTTDRNGVGIKNESPCCQTVMQQQGHHLHYERPPLLDVIALICPIFPVFCKRWCYGGQIMVGNINKFARSLVLISKEALYSKGGRVTLAGSLQN